MLRHRQLTLVTIVLLLMVTACRRSTADTATKRVYVAPTTVDCVGAGPQQCYLVTEDLNSSWELLYFDISDFAYQPGIFYQLEVTEEVIDNPPADSSSVRWVWQNTLIMDQAVVKTVTIGPEQIDCAEGSNGRCYQYQQDTGSQWQLYPNEIEGFTYEPGYFYQLTLADRQPADGSGPIWTAMQVLDRSTTPPLPAAPQPPEETAVTETGSPAAPTSTLTFKPIAILDLGLRTVVPESWSAIGSDNRAWAGSSAHFVNFSLAQGTSARAALEQMARIADPAAPAPEIFDAELNGRPWSIFTIRDDVLATTVAATVTEGNVYIVSLFASPNETDAILQAILDNFEVGEPAP